MAISEILLEAGASRAPAASVMALATSLVYGKDVDGELALLQAYQLKAMLTLSAMALAQRPEQQCVLVPSVESDILG